MNRKDMKKKFHVYYHTPVHVSVCLFLLKKNILLKIILFEQITFDRKKLQNKS